MKAIQLLASRGIKCSLRLDPVIPGTGKSKPLLHRHLNIVSMLLHQLLNLDGTACSASVVQFPISSAPSPSLEKDRHTTFPRMSDMN
jgi:hypothetical protein